MCTPAETSSHWGRLQKHLPFQEESVCNLESVMDGIECGGKSIGLSSVVSTPVLA